jgi:hypothetical protein
MALCPITSHPSRTLAVHSPTFVYVDRAGGGWGAGDRAGFLRDFLRDFADSVLGENPVVLALRLHQAALRIPLVGSLILFPVRLTLVGLRLLELVRGSLSKCPVVSCRPRIDLVKGTRLTLLPSHTPRNPQS